MRNLTRTFERRARLPSSSTAAPPAAPNGSSSSSKQDGRLISATCIDPASGRVWVAAEQLGEAAEREVQVYLWDGSRSELELGKGQGRDQQDQERTMQCIARITSFPSTALSGPNALSLEYLAEEEKLCLVLRTGEIALVQLGLSPVDEPAEMEVVGDVEAGLASAAWAPDGEQLVLVTGDDKVLVMSRELDVLFEAPLRPETFGEDEQINVGWGSKRTQFHGSLGKAAASTPLADLPQAHPSDSGAPHITWRGDGQYFAISSLDPYVNAASRDAAPRGRNQVRVYARSPLGLSTTSEPIAGLGGVVAWRPSGNLIAGVKRFGYPGGGDAPKGSRRAQVVFLERNGLQHGEFELREEDAAEGEFRVLGLRWNAESSVLAVWIRRDEGDVVQLWTMGNYHYYLKQEMSAPQDVHRFSCVHWHPERALTLYLGAGGEFAAHDFAWEMVANRLDMPKDTGTVAVVDGAQLLMTPFRIQNVPPPMSAYTISLPQTPVHIALCIDRDEVAALFVNGRYTIWKLQSATKKLRGPRGEAKPAEPIVQCEGAVPAGSLGAVRQISFDGAGVAVLGPAQDGTDAVWQEGEVRRLPGSAGRILQGGNGRAVAVSEDGSLHTDLATPEHSMQVPEFCFDIKTLAGREAIFGFSNSGKLYAVSSDSAGDALLIASDATSFTLSPTFLIYTTGSHESKYVPLKALQARISTGSIGDLVTRAEKRRVERGSQIVTVVPSSMSLVLQMPRGNLETVNPRPLVLEVLKRDTLAGRYRAAFLACRKHRIDLNVLYDLDPEAFMSRLSSFIDQVPEVDYLNLFLSGLKQDLATMPEYNLGPAPVDKHENKVNTICDAVRAELLQRGLVRYIETVLTTHVCKSPPDLEAGLRVLLELKNEQPTIVEDAIRYIIFLANVDRLFDVALGMYDFQLVLMIAQYSQKDPKEYLPFLRELKAYDKYYQRFKIDDHLGRHQRAIENLHAAGPEHFEEASRYIVRHELFDVALKLYAGEAEQIKEIRSMYGEHLYNKQEYSAAALSFVFAERPARAMAAHEQAHQWRELFTLAIKEKVPVDELEDMCTRVAEQLSSSGRYLEAAQVFLDYRSKADGKSGLDEAVHVMCRGSEFAEAYRLTALHDRSDLVEDVIHPGLEDAHETLMDTFEEMDGQLVREVKRIEQLVGPGGRMEVDPDAFFMIENDPAPDNIDIASTATGTTASHFTRYTAARSAFAPSTVGTGHTGHTGTSVGGKSARRKARKQVVGRKGTVGEWEYLVGSLARLAQRVEEKTAEVTPLIPHLLLSSAPSHRELALELSSRVITLRTTLQSHLEHTWLAVPRVEAARRRAVVGDIGLRPGGVGEGAGEGGGIGDALRAWREKEGLVAPSAGPAGQGEHALELNLEPLKIVDKPVLQPWEASRLL